MKYIFLFALLITVIALVLTAILSPLIPEGETFPNGTFIPSKFLECEDDGDCFPGTCCHPTFCMNYVAKPDCTGIACTLDCRKGTMDCGCGSCICVEGKCKASFIESELCTGDD